MKNYTFKAEYNDTLQNYYWYRDGFNKNELDKIYNDLNDVPFQEATTFGSSDKKVRSSRIKWIPMNDQWNWLYTKLVNMAKDANGQMWNFDLYSAPEQIQYTEYLAEDEGHYTWHQDIGPGMGSHRKISITVQLSDADEYEGGDLEMWKGGETLQQAPRGAGVVFIFPSYMMHRVTPVTKGLRRSFVLWVGGNQYK